MWDFLSLNSIHSCISLPTSYIKNKLGTDNWVVGTLKSEWHDYWIILLINQFDDSFPRLFIKIFSREWNKVCIITVTLLITREGLPCQLMKMEIACTTGMSDIWIYDFFILLLICAVRRSKLCWWGQKKSLITQPILFFVSDPNVSNDKIILHILTKGIKKKQVFLHT